MSAQTALAIQLVGALVAAIGFPLYVLYFFKGGHDENSPGAAQSRPVRGRSRGSPAEWDAPEMECSASFDPIVPRFAHVFCSQCGADFGAGDHGYSHCVDHEKREPV